MWIAQWKGGPGWTRAAALAALVCTPAIGATQPGDSITSSFTKQAVAIRPGGATPVAGQVTVGQRIDYVLTASAQGPNGVPASGIVDVLSPNQSYVPGSLQLPPGWTATPNPPYAPNPPNQTTYTAPAAASLLSFQLPVGGNAVSVGASGKGDGMYPIPGANGRVYGVFHHLDSGGSIDCWILTTLARCQDPGSPWPRAISAANDLGTLYSFNGVLVQQRYIYYAAFQRSTGFAGLGCWDTTTEAECTFQPAGSPPIAVAPNFTVGSSQIAGAIGVPGTNRVLIAVNNLLFCYDKSAGPAATAPPCPGWPATGATTAAPHASTSYAHYMDLSLEIGPNPTRVYVSQGIGGGVDAVQCLSLSNGSVCPGAWPATATDPNPNPTYAKNGFALHHVSTATGGPAMVCLLAVDGRMLRRAGTAAPACWNPMGGAATPPLVTGSQLCPFVSGTQVSAPGCVAFSSLNLGSGAGLDRMVFARWSGGPLCVDSNGSPCPGFNSSGLGGFKDYGFAPDPLAPNRCVLALGDAGRIYRFDGLTGAAGCPVTYMTTGNPMDFFCQKKPTQLAWSRIVIRNRPGNLNGGTIVVRNTATQAVLQTITVTASNTYAIMGIPYTSNPTLTVEFTPAYPPNATVTPYALEVQFTANESPQICYQARVERCGDIFNAARFGPYVVPAASSGLTGGTVVPSSWTRNAAVWLGQTKSDPCNPCRDSLDLAIEKRALYPPWKVGSLGEFQILTSVQQGTLDPATAPQPTFVDVLPVGLTFHSFTGTSWSCVATGAQVACTYTGPPVLAGGTLPPVGISVNVVGPLNGGTLVNCARLGPDANLENNRSCTEVRVEPCPTEFDLAIRKEALGGSWKAGTVRAFAIRVSTVQGTYNPATAPAPTFVDVLPAGMTFASATGVGWTCTPSGSTVACTFQAGGPLPTPATLPVLTLNVQLVSSGPRRNCAVLGPDMNATNNQGCASVDVGQ